jgi:hypothetical protein
MLVKVPFNKRPGGMYPFLPRFSPENLSYEGSNGTLGEEVHVGAAAGAELSYPCGTETDCRTSRKEENQLSDE